MAVVPIFAIGGCFDPVSFANSASGFAFDTQQGNINLSGATGITLKGSDYIIEHKIAGRSGGIPERIGRKSNRVQVRGFLPESGADSNFQIFRENLNRINELTIQGFNSGNYIVPANTPIKVEKIQLAQEAGRGYPKYNYTIDVVLQDVSGLTISGAVQPLQILSVGDSPQSAQPGQNISFQVNAFGGYPPYQYFWVFGDLSGLSSLQNPTYAYKSGGIFNPYVTILDTSGDVTQANAPTVTVSNTTGSGFITINLNPASGNVPVVVTVSGTAFDNTGAPIIGETVYLFVSYQGVSSGWANTTTGLGSGDYGFSPTINSGGQFLFDVSDNSNNI